MLNRLLGFLFQRDGGLRVRSVRAGAWVICGRGLSQFLRLISNLILTRLLMPEAFGLVAVAQAVMMALTLLAETGVRPAIIQNPRGADRNYLETAWLVGVARGAILTLAALLVSWPMSHIYGQPELKGLIPLLGVGAFIQAFESPGVVLLVRELDAFGQAVLELTRQLGGLIVTLALAWMLRTVWALPLGMVGGNVVGLAMSYLLCPMRPTLAWDKDVARELFAYGKFIFLNTLITFGVMNGDRLILGRMLPLADLGQYAIALNLALPLVLVLIQMSSQVIFPALSARPGDIECARRAFQRIGRIIALTVLPTMAIVAVFGDTIVRMLYDPRYTAAGVVLCWMGVRFLYFSIHVLQGGVFLAMGKPSYETASFAAGLVMMLVLLPVGASGWGLTGAAAAVCASGVVVTGVGGVLVSRLLKVRVTVLELWCWATASLVFAWLVRQSVERFAELAYMNVVALVVACCIFAIFLYWRRCEILELIGFKLSGPLVLEEPCSPQAVIQPASGS